jgi:hypothetical protein
VILTTSIIMLAALVGLTAHASRASNWRDPGARCAWALGAGIAAAVSLLGSLTLSVLTRPVVFVVAALGMLAAGGISAWRASEVLRVRSPSELQVTDAAAPARAVRCGGRRRRGLHLRLAPRGARNVETSGPDDGAPAHGSMPGPEEGEC